MRHLSAALLAGCVLACAQHAHAGRSGEDPALQAPRGSAQEEAYGLGKALAAKGDYAGAVARYGEAIALQADFVSALTARGFAYLELGDYPRAIADHDAALTLTSQYGGAWGNSCWARAVANVELDVALDLCDMAVRIRDGRPRHFDSRGLVHFRRGEFVLAAEDYGKAVGADGDWASPLFMRGVTRLRLGREAEGREDIARALEIDPKIADTYRRRGVTP